MTVGAGGPPSTAAFRARSPRRKSGRRPRPARAVARTGPAPRPRGPRAQEGSGNSTCGSRAPRRRPPAGAGVSCRHTVRSWLRICPPTFVPARARPARPLPSRRLRGRVALGALLSIASKRGANCVCQAVAGAHAAAVDGRSWSPLAGQRPWGLRSGWPLRSCSLSLFASMASLAAFTSSGDSP